MQIEEIISNMESFTNEEKDIINKMAVGEIEEITPEQLEIYTRYQVSKALAEERFQAEMQALKDETDAKIEQSKQVNNAAIANLEAQAALAQARLEAVKNGKI